MRHPHANPPTVNEDLNRTRLAMHRIYTRWAEQGAATLEAAEEAQNEDQEEAARLGSKGAAISEGNADDDNPHGTNTY